MPADVSPTSQLSNDERTWREIEGLVSESSKLAQSPMSQREFYAALLQRLRQATAAAGCVAWICDRSGQLHPECETWGCRMTVDADSFLETRRRASAKVLESREPRLLPPQTGANGQTENPTHLHWLAHPIWLEAEPQAVLELLCDAEATPDELRGVGQVVAVFADVAREFHAQCQLRELRYRDAAWTELDQFAQRVHRSLELDTTSYVIANEAARVTRCDRVAVLLGPEAGFQLQAISGIDSPDRRSNQVRALEGLARAVAQIGEPLWCPTASDALPAQIDSHLQAYLDVAHVRALAVMPLEEAGARSGDARLPGLLVFERFDAGPWSEVQRRRIEAVCRHGALALRNASELSRLPLLWVPRLAQRFLSLLSVRQLPRTLLCLLAVAGIILALALVPADFAIQGAGKLQPVERRHVFAPVDGAIEKVHARHAELVKEGQALVELRRTELDYELARVLGELQTQQRRLDAVRTSRVQHSRAQTGQNFDDLTAEEERLKTLLASLEEQRAILVRQQTELSVRSPMDGQVLTWNVDETLQARPVRRGQRLMTVADHDGAWQLELHVRDYDVQHLLAARQDSPKLDVSFVLVSRSGQTFHGTLDEIAMSTEMDHERLPSVLVTVSLDKAELPEFRPGATAIAKIHCGRRAIGYIWFRELWDVVWTRWLF